MKDSNEIARSVLARRDACDARRRAGRRRGLRIVAVLVVALSLGGYALAAGGAGEWFTSFFAARTENGLSESQERYIESIAVYEPQTAVSGDWSLTIDYALSDGQDYYMLMTLTGPEDRELRHPSYFIELAYLYPAGHQDLGSWKRYGTHVMTGETEKLPANSVRLLMHFQQPPAEDCGAATQTLHLRNFEVRDEDGGQVERISGYWLFEELTFLDAGEPVELLAEPILVAGESHYTGNLVEVRLDSVQLRPFSLTVEFSRVDWMAFPDLTAQIVRKDGTVLECGFGGGAGPDGGTMSHSFDVPLILSEVDYVLLNGEIRLEMPE